MPILQRKTVLPALLPASNDKQDSRWSGIWGPLIFCNYSRENRKLHWLGRPKSVQVCIMKIFCFRISLWLQPLFLEPWGSGKGLKEKVVIIPNAGEDEKKLDFSYNVNGNVKWCTLETSLAVPLKTEYTTYLTHQSHTGHLFRRHEYVYPRTCMLIAALSLRLKAGNNQNVLYKVKLWYNYPMKYYQGWTIYACNNLNGFQGHCAE